MIKTKELESTDPDGFVALTLEGRIHVPRRDVQRIACEFDDFCARIVGQKPKRMMKTGPDSYSACSDRKGGDGVQ